MLWRAGLVDFFRQTRGFPPKKENIILFKVHIPVHSGPKLGHKENPTPFFLFFGPKFFIIGKPPKIQILPIIQAGPPDCLFGQVKGRLPHDGKGNSDIYTKPCNISRVRWDFWSEKCNLQKTNYFFFFFSKDF